MNALQRHYASISKFGEEQVPRGLLVKSLKNTDFELTPGNIHRRKKSNTVIGFIELLQFISGTFDIQMFEKFAPKARLDLFSEQSAYGPRVVGQISGVIEELRSDKDSRRAVIMIAHPNDTPQTIPCTLSMQFQMNLLFPSFVNEDSVELVTTINMRSSDAVWGLPYDIVQFSGIHLVVNHLVGGEDSGSLVIQMANAHIYDSSKLEKGEEFYSNQTFEMPKLNSWSDYVQWSRQAQLDLMSDSVTFDDVFNIKVEQDGTA
jgi:hypothetical protein